MVQEMNDLILMVIQTTVFKVTALLNNIRGIWPGQKDAYLVCSNL